MGLLLFGPTGLISVPLAADQLRSIYAEWVKKYDAAYYDGRTSPPMGMVEDWQAFNRYIWPGCVYEARDTVEAGMRSTIESWREIENGNLSFNAVYLKSTSDLMDVFDEYVNSEIQCRCRNVCD
jgi:hypothetical protein